MKERRQPRHRAATGQHDVHAQRARLGDGLLHPRGELVGGVQQGAIHIDGDQFDGRLPATHVHHLQPVRGTPILGQAAWRCRPHGSFTSAQHWPEILIGPVRPPPQDGPIDRPSLDTFFDA
ncbi:hypothetical protein D3C72_1918760 [compost metagenome]